MLTELLKTSIIWAALLLFYYAFLSREKAPAQNRIFLWLSLLLGIAIPFMPQPFSIAAPLETVTLSAKSMPVIPNVSAGAQRAVVSGASGFSIDWFSLLFYCWLAGALIQFFILLKNVFQLYYLKQYSSRKHHAISDYFVNDHTPAAFSFGKYIFLPAGNYKEHELNLILQHECRHAAYRHWLDNVVLALLQLVFWFHPFFYLFKHQIKLMHEYQVDGDVAEADSYAYGCLLLAQNQRQFRKNLVHTFNYSPLKKRIAMMTKKRKSGNWKYALAFPLLAVCFVLLSAGRQQQNGKRIRKGNMTYFSGNTFVWQRPPADTVVIQNPVTAVWEKKIYNSPERIVQCDKQPVTPGMDRFTEALVNDKLATIHRNIQVALMAEKDKMPSKIATIQIENIVLNKNFKVLYYDVRTFGNKRNDTAVSGLNRFPKVNRLVDKVLTNPKAVNPKGYQSDKPYYEFKVQVDYKPPALIIRK